MVFMACKQAVLEKLKTIPGCNGSFYVGRKPLDSQPGLDQRSTRGIECLNPPYW